MDLTSALDLLMWLALWLSPGLLYLVLRLWPLGVLW